MTDPTVRRLLRLIDQARRGALLDDEADEAHAELTALDEELDHARRTTADAARRAMDTCNAHDQQRAAAETDRDRLRAVVRRVRQMARAWQEQLPDTIRTAAAADALLTTTEGTLPDPDTQETDRA